MQYTQKFWPIVLLLSPLACSADKRAAARDGPALGAEGKVERGDVERRVVVDGNLYSPSTKALSVQRIRWYWDYNISWTADEGSLVKAGEPIIRLDQSTIQKDMDEKELSLAQQRLELEEEELRAADDVAEAQASVKSAEFDLKKEELMLTDSDAVSESEKKRQRLKVQGADATLRRNKDKVTAARERSARKIESQRIRVKKAEEEVAEMTAGLDKTVITSPQDGLVIFPLYSTNAGWQKARPGAGVQANTVVAEIADPRDLVARIFVPEIDADGIVTGVVGTMRLDILPGVAFEGKVRRVTSVPSTPAERDGNKTPKPSDNVRQIEVLFEVASLPPEAMPGMTTQVTMRPISKTGVIRVPTEALAAQPIPGTKSEGKVLASGGDAYVYAQAKAGGAWDWRPVKLGVQSLTFAEVTDGLAEGDLYRAVAW